MSYVCKSESLKKLQEFYKDKLSELITDKDIDSISSVLSSDKSYGLSLTLCVGVPNSELFEHDISNYIKSLEDCIVKRIKIDDSRNLEVHAIKCVSDEWKLSVKIHPLLKYNYDEIINYQED